jgi:two-component system, NtrC family, nitrogen regulation sensor histidine kinase NtrY
VKNAVEAIEGAGLEAIKDPQITVSAAIEGDRVRVSVSDNGKGWPKENRQRLLEPYITTREKGTGLGLAIVARIIEQHDGKVELIDSDPDPNGRIGASFVFRLPLKQPGGEEEKEEANAGQNPAQPAEKAADQGAGQEAVSAAAGDAASDKTAGEPQFQAVDSK